MLLRLFRLQLTYCHSQRDSHDLCTTKRKSSRLRDCKLTGVRTARYSPVWICKGEELDCPTVVGADGSQAGAAARNTAVAEELKLNVYHDSTIASGRLCITISTCHIRVGCVLRLQPYLDVRPAICQLLPFAVAIISTHANSERILRYLVVQPSSKPVPPIALWDNTHCMTQQVITVDKPGASRGWFPQPDNWYLQPLSKVQ